MSANIGTFSETSKDLMLFFVEYSNLPDWLLYFLLTQYLCEPAPLVAMPDDGSFTKDASSLEAELRLSLFRLAYS